MLIDYFLMFGLFFITALAALAIFLYLYAKVTPYDDYQMIFEQKNLAASLGFSGAIIGLCIPLYSALVHSISYIDFAVWAGVAMLTQLIFALIFTRFGSKYSFANHIKDENTAVGLLMAAMSIAIGLINAGSMSY